MASSSLSSSSSSSSSLSSSSSSSSLSSPSPSSSSPCLHHCVPIYALLLLVAFCPCLVYSAHTIIHQSSNVSILQTAPAFSLYYGRNFKVVRNLFHGTTYLLMQNPTGFYGKDRTLNLYVFGIPLSNYTLDSASSVGFLELLGLFNKLRGVSLASISSPCLLKLISQGSIPTMDATNPDQSLTSSAIFTSLSSTISEASPNNSINFDPLLDTSPMKRAEWIKFLGSFFNMEERANYVFEKIHTSYQCLSNGSSIPLSTDKTVVAWIAYNSGIWTFSNSNYKLQLITDAGGVNPKSYILGSEFNLSIDSDSDEFRQILSTLDVVIDETYAPDPSMYCALDFTGAANLSDSTQFPFLSNNRLWRYDKRVGANSTLDFLEGGVSQPQLVLRDLMEIINPTKAYTTTYFRNIAEDEDIIYTSDAPCLHGIFGSMEPVVFSCQKT